MRPKLSLERLRRGQKLLTNLHQIRFRQRGLEQMALQLSKLNRMKYPPWRFLGEFRCRTYSSKFWLLLLTTHCIELFSLSLFQHLCLSDCFQSLWTFNPCWHKALAGFEAEEVSPSEATCQYLPERSSIGACLKYKPSCPQCSQFPPCP